MKLLFKVGSIIIGGSLIAFFALFGLAYYAITSSTETPTAMAVASLQEPEGNGIMVAQQPSGTTTVDDLATQQLISTSTPYPSHTPWPTYTPQPTYTPLPTYTSEPTYTPGPTRTNVPMTPFSPPSATPTETPIPTDTAVPTIGPSITPKITVVVRTRTPVPTATEVITGLRLEIISSQANLRSGPGTSYSVAGTVAAGAVLRLVGKTSDGYWYQVLTADGQTAWVGSTVARIDGGFAVGSVPVVATVAAPPLAPAIRAPAPVNPNPAPAAPSGGCCKICRRGKACGNTCINRNYNCYQPPGCACNAGLTPPIVVFGFPGRTTAALLGLDPVSFLCLTGSQAEDI